MNRTRLVAVALVGMSALTGCSGEEAAPSERSEPNGAAASDAPDPALDFGGTAEEIAEEPVVVGCAERYPTVTLYDEVTADRELTLDSVSAFGVDGVTVVQAWVAPLREKRVSTSGVLAEGAGGTQLDDIEPWADRGPLAGTELTSGSTYEYFLELSVEPGRRVSGFEFTWTADGEAGSSTYALDLRTEADCPA